MDLPYNQNGLIMDLLQVNKKLVVINISGTGVAMPWKNQAWYLGPSNTLLLRKRASFPMLL